MGTYIVRRKCELGKVDAALVAISEIEESLERNVARITLAKAIFQQGKHEAAGKLARFAEKQFGKIADQEVKDYSEKLANLYGALRDQKSVTRLMAGASDEPIRQAAILSAAFRGYAESVTSANAENK